MITKIKLITSLLGMIAAFGGGYKLSDLQADLEIERINRSIADANNKQLRHIKAVTEAAHSAEKQSAKLAIELEASRLQAVRTINELNGELHKRFDETIAERRNTMPRGDCSEDTTTTAEFEVFSKAVLALMEEADETLNYAEICYNFSKQFKQL